MKPNEDLIREYRGYQIIREGNGQIGCPGNENPGCYYTYNTYKDGQLVNVTQTLKMAKFVIDRKLQPKTQAELDAIARFTASLNAQTAVA